jgi:hypothetical protein
MPEVVRSWKEGSYGTTVWFHQLSCGHVSTARRRSTKPALPCAVCDQLSSLPEETGVELLDAPPVADEHRVTPDETARLLEEEALLRVRVASALRVPVDSVSVVSLDTGPAVVVTLFPPQVSELLTRG